MMNKHLAEVGNQVNTSWPEAANALNGLEQQAMLSALQELYGYTFLFGMAVLVLIATYHFRRKLANPIPTLKSLYALCRIER